MTEVPRSPVSNEEYTQQDWESIRSLGRDSLYFFSKAILGYDKLVPHVHKKFCTGFDELADGIGKKRRVFLMPRGHYKTTVGTIADSIRRLARNADERILLANEATENSQLMLAEIKRHFTNNERFKMFYPEIIPKSLSQTVWSKDAMLIPRPGIWREPSITAVGVKSAVVSRHFTVIKCDDLIGMEAKKSPTIMEDAKNWLGHAVSLLVSAKTGEIHVIGTRWALDDVYQHAMDSMNFDTFIRKAIVLGHNGQSQPFFPEEFTMEFFADIIENDAEQWANQYANDPYDMAQVDFKKEWLQYFRFAPDGDIRYEDEHGRLSTQPFNKLRFYVHVDPSMGESPDSDYSAVIVVGVNSKGEVFVIDVWRERVNPTRLIDKIFEVHDYFSPKRISIETNAFQKALMYWIRDRSKREFKYLPLEDFKASSQKTKEARIRGSLQPYFRDGLIYIHPRQTELVEEYLHFGSGGHDDAIDALAQGPEFWRSPRDDAGYERHKRQVRELMQTRGVTGYGI